MVLLLGFPEGRTGAGEECLVGLPDNGPLIGKQLVPAVLMSGRRTAGRPEEPQPDEQMQSEHSLTLSMVQDAVHLPFIQILRDPDDRDVTIHHKRHGPPMLTRREVARGWRL